jgi:hypothetical protein
VRRELLLAASGERRHLIRFRIGLVSKENAEVRILDRPEAHLAYHVTGFRHSAAPVFTGASSDITFPP